MPYVIKHYPNDTSYHKVFHDVVTFLSNMNEKYQFLHFHWSRFEGMFARGDLKTEELSSISLFVDDQDQIKGLLTYEDEPHLWFAIYEDHIDLKKAIFDYYFKHHKEDDLIIPHDLEMMTLLNDANYEKTDWIDSIMRFSLDDFEYPHLLDFHIKSLEEDYRLDQIHHALWKGFNHGDDIDYSIENLESRRHMTSSPHFKKKYTFVAIKDDSYVSYAGIWYLDQTKTALIEPVATVPEHRRKGLSKACIYHAIKEVRKDGAKDIFVDSTQQFYKDIGFEMYHEAYRFKKVNRD